jgi:hypothetical protein
MPEKYNSDWRAGLPERLILSINTPALFLVIMNKNMPNFAHWNLSG